MNNLKFFTPILYFLLWGIITICAGFKSKGLNYGDVILFTIFLVSIVNLLVALGLFFKKELVRFIALFILYIGLVINFIQIAFTVVAVTYGSNTQLSLLSNNIFLFYLINLFLNLCSILFLYSNYVISLFTYKEEAK